MIVKPIYPTLFTIEESLPRVDSLVPLMHHDPSDLRLIYLIKKSRLWILESNVDFFKGTHPHSFQVACSAAARSPQICRPLAMI